MGVGGSILHSIWKQDFYLNRREEEDEILLKLQNERTKVSETDNTSSIRAVLPQPIICPIQFTKYLDHLQSLPSGERAKGQLQYIRLINKRKLFRNPVIHWIVRQYMEVLLQFDCIATKRPFPSSSALINPASKDTTSNLNQQQQKQQQSLLSSQEYEYRFGLRSKFALNIYQNILEEVDATRKALERMLLWQSKSNNFSDSFCEIYDLQDHPRYTYLSHRWLEQGRNPFGLHNELIVFLLLAKEDYVWLDCTCVPQVSSTSKREGDDTVGEKTEDNPMMKMVWNIGKILEEASNVATYYATDGWKTCLLSSSSLTNDFSLTSLGFFRLYQCLFPSLLVERIQEEIEELQLPATLSLWCYAETHLLAPSSRLAPADFHGRTFLSPFLQERIRYKKRIGQESLRAIESLPVSSRTTSLQAVSPQSSIDNSSITLTFYNHRRIHAENALPLDCTRLSDAWPLTLLLYEKQQIPCIWKNANFLCFVPSIVSTIASSSASAVPKKTMEWKFGFHLPELSWVLQLSAAEKSTKEKSPSSSSSPSTHSHSSTIPSSGSYGWYRVSMTNFDDDPPQDRARYYFTLHTSQRQRISLLRSDQDEREVAGGAEDTVDRRDSNQDYLVLMIHEDCYLYCAQFYELYSLSYESTDMLRSSFQNYSQAYEWEHYLQSYCQLCEFRKYLEKEKEREDKEEEEERERVRRGSRGENKEEWERLPAIPSASKEKLVKSPLTIKRQYSHHPDKNSPIDSSKMNKSPYLRNGAVRITQPHSRR